MRPISLPSDLFSHCDVQEASITRLDGGNVNLLRRLWNRCTLTAVPLPACRQWPLKEQDPLRLVCFSVRRERLCELKRVGLLVS